jgi:hypothetical protein
MATPIIRMKLHVSPADQDRASEQIKSRMQTDGLIVLDMCCELLGVIQDDGTFMPYAPNGTYLIPESKESPLASVRTAPIPTKVG